MLTCSDFTDSRIYKWAGGKWLRRVRDQVPIASSAKCEFPLNAIIRLHLIDPFQRVSLWQWSWRRVVLFSTFQNCFSQRKVTLNRGYWKRGGGAAEVAWIMWACLKPERAPELKATRRDPELWNSNKAEKKICRSLYNPSLEFCFPPARSALPLPL